MQGDPRWNPERSGSFWINRASRLILKRHESRLRPLGFGMANLPVLLALAESDGLQQKELAERAFVEQPSMAEMLARLERDELVTRAPLPEDKRGSLVTLTKKARTRLPKGKSELLRGEDEAMSGLTREEKSTLIALLQKVVANLEAPSE